MDKVIMRLDRYLSLQGEYSRREAAELIRAGQVSLNGQIVKDGKIKISSTKDTVLLCGETVHNTQYRYFMMNKPGGILTAAKDSHASTVMDFLPTALAHRDVRPVGRLDKDTTGLLLLTNDGAMAHRLLSPKHHVWKQYEATVSGKLSEEDVVAFHQGMNLGNFISQPAELLIHEAQEDYSTASVRVHEGKFHQVRRMFAHIGHEVRQLHRSAFGSLTLPADLKSGEYRELTQEEFQALLQDATQTETTK